MPRKQISIPVRRWPQDFLVNMDNKEIGRRIRMVRQEHNLKQEEFCNALGISRFSLGRIERGDQTIDGQSLHNLHEKFGSSSDFILFGEEGNFKDYQDLQKELESTKELLAAKTEIIQLLKDAAGVK